MADYISRKAAIGEFETCGSVFVYGKKVCKAIISRLNVIPAADVVEVVRCKECKYSDTFSDECEPTEFPLKCLSIRYGGVYQDWFCEHGRRREDGDGDG